MESIAHEFNTSRSTVSRWLSEARETGHVQIVIHDSLDSPAQLERRLATRFGVRAVVASLAPRASESETLEAVAAVAARTLAAELVPGSVLGVAWGSTVSAVARHLPPKRVPETTVVQLNGAGNTHSSGILYASEILRRFAQAFGAQSEQFPVPTFFDNPLARELMWQERSVKRIRNLQKRAAIAVFGIGALDAHIPSHVYIGGYLEHQDLAELRSQGIAGDIATRFFHADGSYDGIQINQRSSALEFPDFLAIPTRMCVVSGTPKVPGVRAALAGGFITDLVLDERAARLLLEEPSSSGYTQNGALPWSL